MYKITKITLIAVLMLFTGFAFANEKIEIDKETQECIDCHTDSGMAPKMIDSWKESKHAQEGIGCLSCHQAEKGEFDAFEHAGTYVGLTPTPKDCATCHEQEVEENTKSKHAYQFWVMANTDGAIFDPIIGTKQGCNQCHTISNPWPDGSIGECDACHTKHSFSLEVARNPQTCGECHLGPDHPHIEIYMESKHGNVFAAKGKDWDLSYDSKELDGIPIEAPVCTTCHMDAAQNVKATHNVSERLSWEMQAPWSYRTIWHEEELGDWKDKNNRMRNVCKNCHAPTFIEDHFLVYDLVNLQYNEIRREFLKWAKIYEEKGLIKPLKEKVDGKTKQFSSRVINSSWYTTASHLLYNAWHHEGRRFRHGSAMGGADYVQWHGIWEIQHDLQEMIAWGAEHGVKEAEKIYNAATPAKFFPYKLYDMPGEIYHFQTRELSDVAAAPQYIDNYWEKVKANVEQAYKKGLLAESSWERWLVRYNNRDHFQGTKYGKHPAWEDHKERKNKELNLKDPKSPISRAVNVNLPSPSPADEKIK